jgi:hypothetical protein
MTIEEDNPVAAVHEFIENIVATGLRGFIYRVDHNTTGETLFVSGDGAVYSTDDLQEILRETKPTTDVFLPEPAGEDTLLAEAEALGE